MFSRGYSTAVRLVNQAFRPQVRSFANNAAGNSSRSSPRLTDHRPNEFEKWLLVHFKKYPKGQVPDLVPQGTMEKARNLGRIKFNLYMGVATLFGIFVAVYMGKKDRAEGKSWAQMNRDWHAAQNKKTE